MNLSEFFSSSIDIVKVFLALFNSIYPFGEDAPSLLAIMLGLIVCGLIWSFFPHGTDSNFGEDEED